MATSSITKRACDACHRRKVRCNGTNPCQNCMHASLSCTFNKPPQKKGPKGSRAKVIAELRKSQELSSVAAMLRDVGSDLPSPTSIRQAVVVSAELVHACVSFFFERFYPTMPILDRMDVERRRNEMHTSKESYCLITSLCAFMVIQPGMNIKDTAGNPIVPSFTAAAESGRKLVNEVRRVRNGMDYKGEPTLAAVVTSFFLSASYIGLEKHTNAWFHLQEAVLLARVLRIHNEATYQQGEIEAKTSRRVFWMLFLTERAQALQKHRDLTFQETLDFPKADVLDDIIPINGFNCLINTFRIVDDRFSMIWNAQRSHSPIPWPADTYAWLSQMQMQLTEAVPEQLECTENQEADLRITQLWLSNTVWQLATSRGVLSSATRDVFMSLTYPLEIARELFELTTRISFESVEVHGIGMVEKLFDIACSLADVITLVSPSPSTTHQASIDHLVHLLRLISALRHGETRFVSLLQTKIRETLPELAIMLSIPDPPQPQPQGQQPAQSQNQPRNATTGPFAAFVSSPTAIVGSPHPSMASHTSTTTSNPSFPFERTIKHEHSAQSTGDSYTYSPGPSNGGRMKYETDRHYHGQISDDSSREGSPYGSPPQSVTSGWSGTHRTGAMLPNLSPGLSNIGSSHPVASTIGSSAAMLAAIQQQLHIPTSAPSVSGLVPTTRYSASPIINGYDVGLGLGLGVGGAPLLAGSSPVPVSGTSFPAQWVGSGSGSDYGEAGR